MGGKRDRVVRKKAALLRLVSKQRRGGRRQKSSIFTPQAVSDSTFHKHLEVKLYLQNVRLGP